MRTFDILAINPSRSLDPGIAIAASRAGGIGIVNLESSFDIARARAALARASEFGTSALGVMFEDASTPSAIELLASLPDAVQTIIMPAQNLDVATSYVTTCQTRGCRVLIEVHNVEQALSAEKIGADGLIAKGHEAGGWVGETTTFVLLQQLMMYTTLPVYARGGIGIHTAAACYVAGVAGIVLDDQLALARESPVPEAMRAMLAVMDGSETTVFGAETGLQFRGYARPSASVLVHMHASYNKLATQPLEPHEQQARWRELVAETTGGTGERLVPLAQDIAFAASLARQYGTVGGIIQAMREAVYAHVEQAQRHMPLGENAPLAVSHGIRYPIAQGPMTRVSDRAEFALRVAEQGGLPFLALALMPAPEVQALLDQTKQLLGDRPWGVGILGFVSPELRREQIEVIRQYRPPVAIIAGGRPDQAHVLEQDNIPTYLHVPSPGLLRMFLQDGSRRFIFEGRECGGHVGPRSSFVLWNTMIDVLLNEVSADAATQVHVLFAGGIHDARSSAMVAALAAPLAERGMRIGVLMGTSYIFTEEATSSEAIVAGFQEEALRCTETRLIESGPGHAIRCAPTAFIQHFAHAKQQLAQEGSPHDAQRLALEDLTVGRLRVASKGIARDPRFGLDPAAAKYMTLDETNQRDQGMYMLGQVAALRDTIGTIADLHYDVSHNGNAHLLSVETDPTSAADGKKALCDVAIIGMACMLPKAPDLQLYWENILNKVNAVTEVPANRWDWRRHYDQDRTAQDKIYSRWGGFLDDAPFDPMSYGIPPNALRSIEPIQLLTLEVVRAALTDAGYIDRPFPREQTSVILGAGGGIGDLGQQYTTRAMLPDIMDDVPQALLDQFPKWTEDSFPGILLNVISGRVSNRFDLGGVNYTVDAACASSLASVYQAVRELQTGTSDMVITGGVDNVQNPFAFLAFSKTHALSPRGQCRTFDDSADGIAIAEGVAIVVLKRLADAERDGDRIYAVVKGVAGSSDGRDRSLTAPRPEGQARALNRAYRMAGFSPATVSLIEAHGTGTIVGDKAEVETLKQVFGPAGAVQQSCAIGSVKSMIGHTKAAAGVAGLIKVAMALHHKVLPATLGVEKPSTKIGFEDSPFYINANARPWLKKPGETPRRAGVSAFGFGGTNFHVVLEEYTRNFMPVDATAHTWPSELLLWSMPSRTELADVIQGLQHKLEQGAQPRLRDLAWSLYTRYREQATPSNLCLSIVTDSLVDLQGKLAKALRALATDAEIADGKGVYFTENPLAREGKLAFLFPGQGSQYPNMLRDLTLAFPEVRASYEQVDQVLASRFTQPLSTYIFPVAAFDDATKRLQQEALTQTNVAQPALGATSLALHTLLDSLDVRPDMVGGHSYGEYVALYAAGAIDQTTLAELSEVRGRSIIEAAHDDLGTMAAVGATEDVITSIIGDIGGVWVANLNSPRQTMISGTHGSIDAAVERLKTQGISARAIPVAAAFHSPIVASARERLQSALKSAKVTSPRIPVFSNTTATSYPVDPGAMVELLADHLVRPVRWIEQIEAMYAEGARLFVEVGPRDITTGLARTILGERPHVGIVLDLPDKPGLTQLQRGLAQLAAHGVSVNLARLFEGRQVRKLNVDRLVEETTKKPLASTTWMINGGQARPLREVAHVPFRPVNLRDISSASSGPATDSNHSDSHVPPMVDTTAMAVSHNKTPNADRYVTQPTVAQTTGNGNVVSNGTPHEPILQQASEPPPVNESAPGSGLVMDAFHNLMGQFLITQRNVMMTYIDGASTPENVTPPSRQITSPTPVRHPDVVVTESVNVHLNNGMVNSQPYDRVESTTNNPGVEPIEPRIEPPSADDAQNEPTPGTDETFNREQLTATLLTIVADRTGYPNDMLEVDQDLEAHLGIDSIKRVEIVEQLTRLLPGSHQVRLDELSQSRTLRQIIDHIDGASPSNQHSRQNGKHAGAAISANANGVANNSSRKSIDRFLLRVEERPARAGGPCLAPGRVVLITDDGTGIAHTVADKLAEHGFPTVILPLHAAQGGIDLTAPEAIASLVESIHGTKGSICALLHLIPLARHEATVSMGSQEWNERLGAETRSLFLLAKALRADLMEAASAGGAAIVAATGMGGNFGLAHTPTHTFFPGQGAIAGFCKSLAREWPEVRVASVDLATDEGIPTISANLLQELFNGGDLPEVGYRAGRRLGMRSMAAPVGDHTSPVLDSNSVVLITGGARGITADIVLELAQKYRPTLVLVGLAPLPSQHEAPDTVGIEGNQPLKAALISRWKAEGREAKPQEIEGAFRRLHKEREIRHNLSLLQATDARVEYRQVDVRDDHAFGRCIEDIYARFGRLDGVVHGAGIIEDKLVENKSVASFDRVIGTKVESALTLARHLQPESLRFLVLFGSVAGTYGNAGQADYASANEVLNKLAIYLDERWPARVVTINWGPWAKHGMVTSELEREFARRGVAIVPPEQGRRRFLEELSRGRKGEAVVIVGGDQL